MHSSALYRVIVVALLAPSGLLAQQPAPGSPALPDRVAPVAPPLITKDEMETRIVPLRYGEAAKFVENLRPLLGETGTLGANQRTNSIILSDTQTNVRRIVQIITLIDEGTVNAALIPSHPGNDVLRRMMERRAKELSK